MNQIALAEQIAHADRRVKWLRRCVESDLTYLCEMEAISTDIKEMEAVLATLWGVERTDNLSSYLDKSRPAGHASDCAVHNRPAYEAGPCDCGAAGRPEE